MAKRETEKRPESETSDLPRQTMRLMGLAYAVVAFVFVYVVFIYFGIVLISSKPTPSGDEIAVSGILVALATNLCLVGIFVLQHSLMARSAFKRWWTRIVPEGLERSTYVHAANITFALLIAHWQSIPMVIWHVETEIGRAIIWGIFAIGWVIVVGSSFLIDQFELLGLRQAWAWFRMGTYCENKTLQTDNLYAYVRHPMYIGAFMIFWATPHMSIDQFMMASALTIYALIASYFEERDLVHTFGAQYEKYQQHVPRIIPSWRRYEP